MSSHRHGSSVYDLPELTPQIYAQWRASELGVITERLERRLVLERMGTVVGKEVLEIGCGDGDLAVQLAEMGARVRAIDSSEAMIVAARARAAEHRANVDFRVGLAQELPFEADSFDIVVAVTVLCFVSDTTPILHEIARTLKPGGHLVIGELGKWNSWAARRRFRAWLGSPLWKLAHFRTPRDLRQLAKDAGLHPCAVQGAIYYPPWPWAARLLAPMDNSLSRITNAGAAFLVLEASKPE